MTKKPILVIGTMDTKAAELVFLRDRILSAGGKPVLIDVSTRQGPHSPADITAQHVAAYHPEGPASVFMEERGAAVAAMSQALVHAIDTLDPAAAIGIGGSGGTALIAPALRRLPLGIPKLLISTVASGTTSSYVDTSDLILIPSVTDISGVNRISLPILANAAAAIAAMAVADRHLPPDQRPAIGLTMFGVTTPCVSQVARELSDDFDPIVFHATGTGGRAMEQLAGQGLLQAILDLTTTELCDRLAGGIMPAGPDRIVSLAKLKLPYLGSVGALDIINFGAPDTVPERYAGRLFHHHNPQITLMRTSVEECERIGEEIGQSLNMFDGPAVFLIPEHGVSALDAPGQPFHNPQVDGVLFSAIEGATKQTGSRRIIRLPHHINDSAFAHAAARELQEIMRKVQL